MITACPDGEGAWYQETVRNHAEVAERLKAEYKAKFTQAFAERVAESVRLCKQALTLIDMGGVVDDENELIARHASHAVLIAAQTQDLGVWRDFCGSLQNCTAFMTPPKTGSKGWIPAVFCGDRCTTLNEERTPPAVL